MYATVGTFVSSTGVASVLTGGACDPACGERSGPLASMRKSVPMKRDDTGRTGREESRDPGGDGGLIVGRDTEFGDVFEQVQEAMKMTAELNAMVTADFDAIRSVFSRLTGEDVDPTFRLIPPFYTNYGRNIHVGKNVFINYACSFNDIGGITLEDDVMIAARVNLVTAGHPLDPAQRRHGITYQPITIKRNVWIATAATILAGVTVGENAVVAAGAVVTKDVQPNCMVAGVPAKVVKRLD
jgi:acetyltransferase-like isoleucine patch superfamily enzyme